MKLETPAEDFADMLEDDPQQIIDWAYMFSDDNNVYEKGLEQENVLKEFSLIS